MKAFLVESSSTWISDLPVSRNLFGANALFVDVLIMRVGVESLGLRQLGLDEANDLEAHSF